MAVWHELIIAGGEDACRAFVAGVAAGRGSAANPIFGRDCHLAPERLGERLRALFVGGSHHVVFVPEPLAAAVATAVRERGATVGLRLERRRIVRSMYFDFRVEAFSREVMKKIRRTLISGLPSGIRVDDLVESSEQDPSAEGAEMYSPAHEFVYRASGRVAGLPPAIFDVRALAAKLDFVTVYELHVQSTAS